MLIATCPVGEAGRCSPMPVIDSDAVRGSHRARGQPGFARVALALCILASSCAHPSTPAAAGGGELRERFTAASTRWASRRAAGYRFVLAGRYARRLCEIDIVAGRRTQY